MTDWNAVTKVYHEKHPEVLEHLTTLAYKAKEKGYTTVGIELLTNLLRWEYGVGFPQNCARTYKFMIMENHPDLVGFFNFKKNGLAQTEAESIAEELEAA